MSKTKLSTKEWTAYACVREYVRWEGGRKMLHFASDRDAGGSKLFRKQLARRRNAVDIFHRQGADLRCVIRGQEVGHI